MEITAIANQRVEINDNVNFTETVINGNCSIMHRPGSGLVKLRGLTCGQCRARFKVFFNGNIAIAAGEEVIPASIAITVDGEPLAASKMVITPTDEREFWNVASSIYVDVPSNCCSTIGVTNTTPRSAIAVQNANLIVERVA